MLRTALSRTLRLPRTLLRPASTPASTAPLTLGFIGLGNMGKSMAENLIKTHAPGETIYLFDISATIAQSLVKTHTAPTLTLAVAPSVSFLAQRCDVIVTMVPATAHVEGLMFGATPTPTPNPTPNPTGILRSAKSKALIIDCSTIDPLTSR